jgi:hypothetical protein
MTHTSCPACRIRFTPAVASALAGCPHCGKPLHTSADPLDVVGFRLFRLQDVPHPGPDAIAVSVALPDPATLRSSPDGHRGV